MRPRLKPILPSPPLLTHPGADMLELRHVFILEFTSENRKPAGSIASREVTALLESDVAVRARRRKKEVGAS